MYCERCGEEKPEENCQKDAEYGVVCWDCFEKRISAADAALDALKDSDD